ncbi:MAG: LytTR family transcriptional regulator DNA-binding domain-containing protein [Rhodothermales bacterium]
MLSVSAESWSERVRTLEERLDPHRFFRIHRSTIVQLDRVEVVRFVYDAPVQVVPSSCTSFQQPNPYGVSSLRLLRCTSLTNCPEPLI